MAGFGFGTGFGVTKGAVGPVIPPVVAPSNTGVPAITGTAQEGQTLTASTGTWDNAPTSYTYQWKRNGANISGATASTYPLVAADVGTVITVTVTATNTAGSASATSAATASILPPAPVNSVLPAITGTAQEGQTLTSSTGTWSGSPTYARQWKRDGVAISGATASTYVLTTADVGTVITVTVTATNTGGSASATSTGTASVIALAPTNSVAPAITGTAREGQTLSTSNGTWANNPVSYTYQWKRAGVNISGATASTYVLVTADVGSVITVTVTATNTGGSASSTSAGTSAVIALAPVNSTLPTITGTAQQGQTLSTSNGTWANNPVSYTYQWKRAGVDISGATASTYVLVSNDVGASITVAVTATNTGGSASATSAGTSSVIALPPVNTVLPAITGTAQEGQTLSASTGTWSNSPSSYVYQWKRDGVAISGATGASYFLDTIDVGKVITVTVTATNTGGSVSATSNGTSAVLTAGGGAALAIAGTLDDGFWFIPYSDTLVISGGTGPYTYVGGAPTGTSVGITGGNVSMTGTPV